MIARRMALIAKLAAQAMSAPVAFAACALVERDGKILLARHSYVAGWLLPGGGVGRGEPAEQAILRELKEEIGLERAAPPELFGLYSRKVGLVTNVIALFRLRDVEFTFTPNLEIREVLFADPASPPPLTAASVRRRLAEHIGAVPRSPYW
ncbi:MAG TPA: NUDIX domain-containing protein [Rhizomicrobium sp.]|jgi:ADP-ribose pyrophosphatase YjhB (NUDIX family)|nr:NUDIX domain-containing protein [Rhizomicrobium sp.]